MMLPTKLTKWNNYLSVTWQYTVVATDNKATSQLTMCLTFMLKSVAFNLLN